MTPIPRALADRVRALRLKLEAFGDGYLFPTSDPKQPWSRDLFDQALRNAEKQAGLSKLNGSLWRPYRRKWGTERKHLPTADVIWAGWPEGRGNASGLLPVGR